MNEDTCSNFLQVAKLTLSSPEAIGGRSLVDLREAQLADPDIKPVLMRMEERNDKPSLEETAPHSQATKVYCSQWESLRIFDSVLYRLWETPYNTISTPKGIEIRGAAAAAQCPNSWSLGDCQDPGPCQRKILLGPV